jgi:exopolyphosphatase/pppGpp-phosphohydrolase
VLTAAAIMLQIMELAGVADAYVSNRGLRHGVARDMLLGLSRDSGVFRRDALLEAVARTASGL